MAPTIKPGSRDATASPISGEPGLRGALRIMRATSSCRRPEKHALISGARFQQLNLTTLHPTMQANQSGPLLAECIRAPRGRKGRTVRGVRRRVNIIYAI
jgi:hypothetical protein